MKPLRHVRAAVVLCGILVMGAGLAAQQSVFLGVVREDGLMIPIAIHDGREWWNAWPFSHESDQTVVTLPVPASLAQVPTPWLPPGVRLPTAWTMYPRRGRPRPLRLGSLARPEGFSLMAFIGIRTSLPRAEVADSAYEVGVAISGPGTLTSVDSLDTASAEYRRLMTAVLRGNALREPDFEVLAVLKWRGPSLWVVRFRAEDGFSYGLLEPSAADLIELPMKGLWELRPR